MTKNNLLMRSNKVLTIQTSKDVSPDIIKGIFLIIGGNTRGDRRTYFMFWDSEKNKILHYKIHEGGSYYKEFINFTTQTIITLKRRESYKKDDNQNLVLLVPKYYSNPTQINKCKRLFNTTLIPYLKRDINFPLNAIADILKNIDQEESSEKSNPSVKSINRFLKRNWSDKPNFTMGNRPFQYRSFSDIIKVDPYTEMNGNGLEGWGEFSLFIPEDDSLCTRLFQYLLDHFWDVVAEPTFLKYPNKLVTLQVKMEFKDGAIRSLSHMDTVRPHERPLFRGILSSVLTLGMEKYQAQDKVHRIYVWYKFMDSNTVKPRITSTQILKGVDGSTNTSHKEITNLIPKNMDFKKWGACQPDNLENSYKINLLPKELLVKLTVAQSGLHIGHVFARSIGGWYEVLSFQDKTHNIEDLTTFTRAIGNQLFYISGGKVIYTRTDYGRQTKYIAPLKKSISHKEEESKIITMDLETCVVKGKMEVVCLSICDTNGAVKTFGIWDFSCSQDLIQRAFTYVLTPSNNKTSIYFHNFSGFDSIFLLKTLVNMENVKGSPIFREGKLISYKMSYGLLTKPRASGLKYQFSLTINDSYLMLPSSLEKLAKTFKIDQGKGFFPLKVLNDPAFTFDYKGSLPPLKYFFHPDLLQKKEYEIFVQKYKAFRDTFDSNDNNRLWVLKSELVKYCERDVIVLRAIILTFSREINKLYPLNIQKYPTLPSVSYATFRTFFLKDNRLIPILVGNIYNDIRRGYYGGFVDIYRPFGKNIKSYDVNSLYPYIMSKCYMPVGAPIHYKGSYPFPDNFFGFVEVKVSCPPHLRTPILPYRYKSESGVITTIYPTGTWTAWYFSEEIRASKKFGYTYKILQGYEFKKKILFKDYILQLYKIKESVSPDDPRYNISKLYMNSLSGRFGMDPLLNSDEFISHKELDTLLATDGISILDTKEVGNKIWVSYQKKKDNSQRQPNVSVAISAAITAYARVEMAQYVMNHSDGIHCIDTDGIKITKKLSPSSVGNKLGQMKFEGEFIESVYIAPKVYGGITTDGTMLVKVKGLKTPISYWLLKSLLYHTKIEISQSKWYRDYSSATIRILEQLYSLAVTSNKRELIRDSVGKFIDTRPWLLSGGIRIIRESFILYYLSPIRKFLTLPLFRQLCLPLNPAPYIIYLQAPSSEIIYIHPSLPSTIYLPYPEYPIIRALPIPYFLVVRNSGLMLTSSYPTQSSHLLLSSPTNTQPSRKVLALPNPNLTIKSFKVEGTRMFVLIQDLQLNSLIVYPSLRAAARALDINVSVLSRRLNNCKQLPPYKGRYNFGLYYPQ